MPPDMKRIILTNMNVKLYWWPLTFHKVVRQQIWAEVIVLTKLPSQIPYEFNSEKIMKIDPSLLKL